MSTTTELAELHHLIGSLRRCVTSLQSKYGDSPHTRRIVNDTERILNDVELLEIDAGELDLGPAHRGGFRGEDRDPGHPLRLGFLA